MNFKKITLLASMIGVLVLGACSQENGGVSSSEASSDEKKIVLTTANITQSENELSQVLERIGKKLDEETDGRITMVHNHGGVLGNESDMLQQLNMGTIQVANITAAQLSNSSEAFGAWLLPQVIEDHDHARAVAESEEAKNLFSTLVNENVVGLGYATSGFRYILSTKDLNSVASLKGFKLRTTPSPTILDFWNGTSAVPTAMPLTEVYTALQTNVIDGVDIDTHSLVSEKITEVAKHMYPTNHIFWAAGVLINKDTWESLSKEDQELMQAIVKEVTQENTEILKDFEKELLSTTADELGVTVSTFDVEGLSKVSTEVQEAWSSKNSEIKSFLEATERLK